MAFSHQGEAWSVAAGWVSIGADRVRGTCARFPPSQAAVLVRGDRFAFRPIAIPRLGIVDGVITSTFEGVERLFPLGLRRRQRVDHWVLVTAGMAGDGLQPEARLFPSPGTRLSVIFYNLDDPRGRELLIHTTTHLLNRRRARRETQPEEPALPPAEYQEPVATWADLALIDVARRPERFEFLLQNYHAALDGDAATTPTNPLLKPLSSWQGPIGLRRVEPPSFAMSEFQHYVLAPLLMLAVDGLLERSAAGPGLWEVLREVHSGRHRGLLAALSERLQPAEMSVAEGWISGVPLPDDLARAGLARLP